MTNTTAPDINLPKVASGKVREIFDAGGDHLLMVATDRVSVYDVVLPTPIPDKGSVLTGLSAFWFGRTESIVPNHLVDCRLSAFPEGARLPEIAGRTMLVRKAKMLPIECVIRGYLSGSGWSDYQRTGSVCGVKLPSGLQEGDQLPEPIFTPATKAASGHDENIDIETAASIVGDAGVVRRAMEISVALYEHGRDHAATSGIILADTKFELGMIDGELALCDEALTPDSSRYWPAATYEPGKTPPSFDKQFVRDYAASQKWDKTPPGPELTDEVVQATRAKYREAFKVLSGRDLDAYLAEVSE